MEHVVDEGIIVEVRYRTVVGLFRVFSMILNEVRIK